MNSNKQVRIDIMSPEEAEKYMNDLTSNENLFALIRFSFEIQWKKLKGIQPNELEILANKAKDAEVKLLYENVLTTLKNDGESTLIASTSNDNEDTTRRKSTVIFAEKHNKKYDLLVVNATQMKQINKQKLATFCLFAVPAGLILSSVATPFITGLSVLSFATTLGLKTAYEYYYEIMPEIIYGYIFKELEEQNLLNLNKK
ncbi:hypothetical protein I4U23_011470 [Adineta vaga]|nr:hypothetical protein I4U23_011470 [Adineta vaga]